MNGTVECTLVTKAIDHTGDFIGGITFGTLGVVLILALLLGYLMALRHDRRKAWLEAENAHLERENARLGQQKA